MTDKFEPDFYILPAEFVGLARYTEDGILRLGTPDENGNGVLEIPFAVSEKIGDIPVYVRRGSIDLRVIEVLIARHDGLAEEELEYQNKQAEIYPLGPKEYWRGEMVGKATYGVDNHLMTNEEFEEDWAQEVEDYEG
jgi:hypothetical protein